MYTLTLLLFFAGFFMFYLTSKRARIPHACRWQNYLAARPGTARILGSIGLLFGWMLLIYLSSGGSGSFSVLAYLMCAGSVLVLMVPLGLFNRRSFAFILSMSFILEYLIH